MEPTDSTTAATLQNRTIEIARTLSPNLAAAIATVEPIELVPRQDAPFPERLCRAIVGQQLSVKAAAAIWGRLLAQAGEQSLIEHLQQSSPEQLRRCGLSGAKAKAVGAIAVAAQAGELSGEVLGRLTVAERNQKLTALWGVGQWTADMMNIFYFGEPDIWPEGDTAARKTLARLTNGQGKTQDIAVQFAPYRSYLALYLWRYLDATPEG
ncbi:MAG: DNA-3-methyladenine glycosylase 2 family protein [Cyanobacteria bacterium P01_G01_bin.54]